MADTRHDALWRRVEAHLDARTDPFQDAALARELLAVPEAEHATRRLQARLGVLQAIEPPAASGHERGIAAANNVHAPAPRPDRARSRPARRFAALAACVAAAVSIVVLMRDDDAARGRSESADSAIAEQSAVAVAVANAARPELGVVYSASIEVERSVPPPPRAALVVHESRQVVEWSLEGNPR